jgi:hypothetical protein
MHEYVSIQINGEEAAKLRQIERVLRVLDSGTQGGSEFGNWADDLHTIARRYERTAEMSGLRVEILAPVAGQIVKFEGDRAHRHSTRGHLHVIEGGSVA